MMFFAGLSGAADSTRSSTGLGHSPAYAGVLYAVQGVGSVAVGCSPGPPCAVSASGGSPRAASRSPPSPWRCGRSPSDPVVLACSAAIGVGLPCVLIAALTAVQRETPDALLGRATATANTLMFTPERDRAGRGRGSWSNWSTTGCCLLILGAATAGLRRSRCFRARRAPPAPPPGPRPTPTRRDTAAVRSAPSSRGPRRVRGERARAAAHAGDHGEVGGEDGALRGPARRTASAGPAPPVQGTTTPSATDRMCAGSTPGVGADVVRHRVGVQQDLEALGRRRPHRRDRRLLEGAGGRRRATRAWRPPCSVAEQLLDRRPSPRRRARPATAAPGRRVRRPPARRRPGPVRRSPARQAGQKQSAIRYCAGVPERRPRRSCRGRADAARPYQPSDSSSVPRAPGRTAASAARSTRYARVAGWAMQGAQG